VFTSKKSLKSDYHVAALVSVGVELLFHRLLPLFLSDGSCRFTAFCNFCSEMHYIKIVFINTLVSYNMLSAI